MKRIWKFPFELKDEIELEMPAGAQVLTADMQGDTPCLWAIVEVTNVGSYVIDTREFHLFGTGHPMPSCPLKYVATFQMVGGSLIWHLLRKWSRHDES